MASPPKRSRRQHRGARAKAVEPAACLRRPRCDTRSAEQRDHLGRKLRGILARQARRQRGPGKTRPLPDVVERRGNARTQWRGAGESEQTRLSGGPRTEGSDVHGAVRRAPCPRRGGARRSPQSSMPFNLYLDRLPASTTLPIHGSSFERSVGSGQIVRSCRGVAHRLHAVSLWHICSTHGGVMTYRGWSWCCKY